MADERRYLAFLVRLWAAHPNGKLLWRASAKNVHTNERHAFADLTSLCRFLSNATAAVSVKTETEGDSHDPHTDTDPHNPVASAAG